MTADRVEAIRARVNSDSLAKIVYADRRMLLALHDTQRAQIAALAGALRDLVSAFDAPSCDGEEATLWKSIEAARAALASLEGTP